MYSSFLVKCLFACIQGFNCLNFNVYWWRNSSCLATKHYFSVAISAILRSRKYYFRNNLFEMFVSCLFDTGWRVTTVYAVGTNRLTNQIVYQNFVVAWQLGILTLSQYNCLHFKSNFSLSFSTFYSHYNLHLALF